MNHEETVRILITAESIIVAGLLAWAQLWTKTYDIYRSNKPPDPVWHISLQLGGIYASTIASVLSIVCAFWSLSDTGEGFFKYAIGFAGCSVTVILFQVFLSLVSTIVKAYRGAKRWHPWLPRRIADFGAKKMTLTMIVLGAFILSVWLFLVGPLLAKGFDL